MLEENANEEHLIKKGYEDLSKQLDDIFLKDMQNNEKEMEFNRTFYNYKTVVNELNVVIEEGLNMNDAVDIERRRQGFATKDDKVSQEQHSHEEHGKNHSEQKLNPRGSYSYLFFLKLTLSDHLLQELITASVLGLIIGILKEGFAHGWVDSFAIILSVLIIAPTTALFNFYKQKKFNKLLNEIAKKKVLVRRNGHLSEIDESELLPGDIIVLQKGDVVNVVGILVKGHVLFTLNKQVYECSTEVTKIIFPMSVVTEGKGLMMVLSTKSSAIHSTNEQEEDDESRLNHDIQHLTHNIEYIGLVMGIVVGIIMLAKTIGYKFAFGDQKWDLEILLFIIDAYIVYDTLVIVALPEGLPMAGSISLAFSISHMLNDQIVINHMNKIATIAQMNYLCINKSSVSENKPQIKAAMINGEHYDKTQNNNSYKIYDDIMGNTTSNVINFEGRKYAKGETIDVALVNFLIDNPSQEQANPHDFNKETPVFRIPFNKAYNYMLSVYPSQITKGKYTAYLRGYYDNIIHMCSNYSCVDGSVKDVSQSQFAKTIEQYHNSSYSIVLFARKELSELELKEDFFTNFTIAGIVGIEDTIQKDVQKSIEQCQNAGIKIIMLCEENIVSSLETCEKINLMDASEIKGTLAYINSKENIEKGKITLKNMIIATKSKELCAGMEGNHFNQMTGGLSLYDIDPVATLEKGHLNNNNESRSSSYSSSLKMSHQSKNNNKVSLNSIDKFKSVVANIKMIAQAQSKDKLLLIAGLQQIDKAKNIIGVCYNGIYDDESLTKANVTFSSNIISNSLDKEQGDVILLKHSFSTLISSIIYARNIYDSIRKFIQFQLTICIVTVTFMTFGNFYLIDVPLAPVQLLWINLIMDSLGALALATDEPSEHIMNYAPYSGQLFNKTMFLNVLSQSLYQIIALVIFLLYGDSILGVPSDRNLFHHQWAVTNGYQLTFIFNLFIFMQIFNMFNSRKVHHAELNIFSGILSNLWFLLVVTCITFFQLILVNFGGRALRTQILTFTQQLYCLGIASGSLVVNFIIKLLPIDREENPKYQPPSKPMKTIDLSHRKLSLVA